MDTVNYIRSEVNAKGHSYSEVARRTNTDARTVKKYADQEEFPAKKRKRKKQRSPVMDPVKEQVRRWKEEKEVSKNCQTHLATAV